MAHSISTLGVSPRAMTRAFRRTAMPSSLVPHWKVGREPIRMKVDSSRADINRMISAQRYTIGSLGYGPMTPAALPPVDTSNYRSLEPSVGVRPTTPSPKPASPLPFSLSPSMSKWNWPVIAAAGGGAALLLVLALRRKKQAT